MSLIQTTRLFVPLHIEVQTNVPVKDYARNTYENLIKVLYNTAPGLWKVVTRTSAVATAVALVFIVGYVIANAIAPQHFRVEGQKQTPVQKTPPDNNSGAQQTLQYNEEYRDRTISRLHFQNLNIQSVSESIPDSRTQAFTPIPEIPNFLESTVSTTSANVTPVLLLEHIDTSVKSESNEVMFAFNQDENIEEPRFTMAITAGYGTSQDQQDPLSGLSLERTDKTWAGRALPLSTVRQIVAQYDWNLEKAIRIIFCESGRNPRVVNNNPNTHDYSIGLFQINLFQSLAETRPSEEWLKNPINNVEYAYRLYQQRGWAPWKKCSAHADNAMQNP